MPKLSEVMGQAPPERLRLSDVQSAPAHDVQALQQMPDVVVRAPERTAFRKVNDFGNDLGDSFAHHVGNIPVGLAQLVGHGITGVSDMLLPAGNAARTAISGTAANFDNFVKSREDQYQATVPNSAGALLGAGIGEVLPWVTGLGELRAAGALPQATTTLGKIGTLAAEGGAMGLTQPVTAGDDASFLGHKALQVGGGAASGPLLYGAGRLAGGIGSGLGDVVQRVRNPQIAADASVANLFGADANTVAKLRAAPQFIPGETPSAAQVLATPEAVKAERLLRNNPSAGVPFAEADNANNAARQDIVSRLAGTPQDMAAAVATRRANAQPFIGSSLTPSQPAVRWHGAQTAFQNVIDNPARLPTADFDAVKQAQTLVRKVRSGDLQEDDAVQELGHLAASVTTQKAQKAFGSAMAAIDKNMVNPTGVLRTLATVRNGPLGVDPKVAEGLDFITKQIAASQNIRGLVGTDILDGVRQQTSRLLGNAKGPVPGVGTQQGVALGPVKDQIVEAIDRIAPGYRDYVAGYRADSTPINTMASISKLADPNAPGSLNTAGDPQLAISRLRQVLRGDDKAKFPMSDDARSQLDAVRESLLRRTISNNPIAASGPATAADLQAAGGSNLGGLIFGNPLGKSGMLTRAIGTGLGGALGSMVPLPGSTLLGAIAGGALPEAVNKVNAGIATRMGATAADSGQTADAILRALSRGKDQGMLSKLLFGADPQAVPQQTLNAARGELDTAWRQLRSATPASQNVPDLALQNVTAQVARRYGIPAQVLIGGP